MPLFLFQMDDIIEATIDSEHSAPNSPIPTGKKTKKVTKKPATPFLCSTCGTSFASRFCLQRHTARVHEPKDVPCMVDDCKKTFSCIKLLDLHVKSVHEKQPHSDDVSLETHVCDSCGKNFAKKRYLQEHKKVHSVARSHKCACGKSFKYRSGLYYHASKCPYGKN